jgi:putative ABC transport system substrate-binding protein
MRRREFIGLVGGAAAWPLAARAQTSAVPTIGFLSSVSLEGSGVPAFRRGLSESGYQEGRNVSIEYRYADGNYDRLSSLATELQSLRVSLIVALPSSPAVVAAKKNTSTIPIVFYMGADPVKLGLVESFNRPGGNVTGIVFNSNEMTVKRLELFHELLPKSVPIALLTNPTNPNSGDDLKTVEQAARAIGRELIVVGATTASEIKIAFETIDRRHAGGVLVWQEAYFSSERTLIVALAARYAIPGIYGTRIFTEIGGLISYGPDRDEMFRLAGIYAGKVLRGTKPADLPVEQPTKFELVINLRTARALGLAVPPTLIARADEVIE